MKLDIEINLILFYKELCSGPSAHGVDQHSRGTLAQFRGPEGSTSCSGGLGTWLEGPQGRPALPRDSGPGLTLGLVCLQGRPTVPGDSSQCPWAHDFNELSRATRDRA